MVTETQSVTTAFRDYETILRQSFAEVTRPLTMYSARIVDQQGDSVPHAERYYYAEPTQALWPLYKFLAAELEALESTPRTSDGLQRSWWRVRRALAEQFGVVCFSDRPDGMLLWSHYANGHRGLALEFDPSVRPIKGWKNFRYSPVTYGPDRRVDVLNGGFRSAFLRLLTHKGADWSYEREYRLVTTHGEGYQQGLVPSLSGVIFGARFLDNGIEPRRALV